jgi:hypothetical protein
LCYYCQNQIHMSCNTKKWFLFLHSKLINFGNKFYIHILPGTLNWHWMTWVFLWQAGQTRILGGSLPGSSHFRSWRTSTRSSTLWPYFTISLLFLLVWKIKIKLKHRTDQDYAIIHISQMLIGNLKFIFEWHKFMEVCLSPLKLWVRIPFRQGVLDTTLCDKVCQWLATGHWFSASTLVSSTNETDSHDITEVLLKVA